MVISIEELRQRIDGKHERALQALEEIKDYLDEGESKPLKNGSAATLPSPAPTLRPKGKRRKGGSIRDRVLAHTDQDWTTAEHVSKQTGLTVKQVRGVLHAPGVKEKVEKREVDGTMQYKTKSSEW